MTIRVGVIGTGAMGADHALRLATTVAGATVTVVVDADRARAADVAARVGPVRVAGAGFELIESADVDAVLIASTAETHAAFAIAAMAAGKPVFCEKPLAPTAAECVRVLEAEVDRGRRLLTMGFMRRLDPGYLEVKAALDGGAIGEPLILHGVHRNPAVPGWFTSSMALTDSMVHEIDVSRWLLGEEVAWIEVIPPKRSPHAAPDHHDPQFAVLGMASGILSTIEFFGNSQYGYDVRCELVGSRGTASVLNPTVTATSVAGAAASPILGDWRDRFRAAYQAEVQAWIAGLERAEIVGPTAWDGYAASRVAEAGVASMASGKRVTVDYLERPALYGP